MRPNRSTYAWRTLRAEALRRDQNACAICGQPANEVDHIIELNEGGSNTLDNLQTLCQPHHSQKTAKYNSQRARRVFRATDTPHLSPMPIPSPTSRVLPSVGFLGPTEP